MASNEGHIHWSGLPDESVAFLGQELRLTSERTNMASTANQDPIGAVRIRAIAFPGTGLMLPTEGWQTIPGTAPALEALAGAHYPVGYIRVRQA